MARVTGVLASTSLIISGEIQRHPDFLCPFNVLQCSSHEIANVSHLQIFLDRNQNLFYSPDLNYY